MTTVEGRRLVLELNEYQRLANRTDQQPETWTLEADPHSILVPLLGLAGEVGELLGEHKKRLRDGNSYNLFPDRVKEELGDLLWYLSNVATKHGLTLEDVAKHNLRKTQRRWLPAASGPSPRKLFDEDYPETERLPRRMDVSIEEDSGRVIATIDGVALGHPLQDNRYEDDGYRYHDVFHLSYASVLGWSPTVRALLRRKRKSNPKVDEIEDGGRAIAIEEGIAGMVFTYAERRNFLEGAEGVDYELLRTVKDMTSHLEVSRCTEGDWERAIMTGFQVWRQVRANGAGYIRVDLNEGTLEWVG